MIDTKLIERLSIPRIETVIENDESEWQQPFLRKTMRVTGPGLCEVQYETTLTWMEPHLAVTKTEYIRRDATPAKHQWMFDDYLRDVESNTINVLRFVKIILYHLDAPHLAMRATQPDFKLPRSGFHVKKRYWHEYPQGAGEGRNVYLVSRMTSRSNRMLRALERDEERLVSEVIEHAMFRVFGQREDECGRDLFRVIDLSESAREMRVSWNRILWRLESWDDDVEPNNRQWIECRACGGNSHSCDIHPGNIMELDRFSIFLSDASYTICASDGQCASSMRCCTLMYPNTFSNERNDYTKLARQVGRTRPHQHERVEFLEFLVKTTEFSDALYDLDDAESGSWHGDSSNDGSDEDEGWQGMRYDYMDGHNHITFDHNFYRYNLPGYVPAPRDDEADREANERERAYIRLDELMENGNGASAEAHHLRAFLWAMDDREESEDEGEQLSHEELNARMHALNGNIDAQERGEEHQTASGNFPTRRRRVTTPQGYVRGENYRRRLAMTMSRSSSTDEHPMFSSGTYHLPENAFAEVERSKRTERNSVVDALSISVMLANVVATHLATVVALGLLLSSSVYVHDAANYFEGSLNRTRQGITYHLAKQKVFYPSELLNSTTLQEKVWSSLPFMTTDNIGTYYARGIQKIKFIYHTAHNTPPSFASYLDQEPDHGHGFAKGVIKKALDDAHLLSLYFRSRVYITDTNMIAVDSSMWMGATSIIYREKIGAAFLASVFCDSIAPQDFQEWMCFYYGRKHCDVDAVSFLESVDLYVDRVGWYYCPQEFLNNERAAAMTTTTPAPSTSKTLVSTTLAPSPYHNSTTTTIKMEIRDDDTTTRSSSFDVDVEPDIDHPDIDKQNAGVVENSGAPEVMDVLVEGIKKHSVFGAAGVSGIIVPGVAAAKLPSQPQANGDDIELTSLPSTSRYNDDSLSALHGEVTPAGVCDSDDDPDWCEEQYNSFYTDDYTRDHEEEGIEADMNFEASKSKTPEVGVVATTAPPTTTTELSTSPTTTTTTEAWIGNIFLGRERLSIIPIRNETVEQYIKITAATKTEVCSKILNVTDVLIRKTRSVGTEGLFKAMDKCRKAIAEGGDLPEEDIKKIKILDGETVFYVNSGYVWMRVPPREVFKHAEHRQRFSAVFKEAIRAMLYTARVNTLYGGRKKRATVNQLTTPASDANRIIGNDFFIIERLRTQRSEHLVNQNLCVATQYTDSAFSSIYDAITNAAWWDARYAKYSLVAEYVDLSNIESDLRSLFGQMSYFEMAAAISGESSGRLIERLIRWRVTPDHGFDWDMTIEDVGRHLMSLSDVRKSDVFRNLRMYQRRVPLCVVMKVGTAQSYINYLSESSAMKVRIVEDPSTWGSYSPIVVTFDPFVADVCKYSIIHEMSSSEFLSARRSGHLTGFTGMDHYQSQTQRADLTMTCDTDVVSALRLYKWAIPRDYHSLLGMP